MSKHTNRNLQRQLKLSVKLAEINLKEKKIRSKITKLRNEQLRINEELMEVFRVFDRDLNGLISAEELQYTLAQLGENITLQEAQDMIDELDLDQDGFINFDEFVAMMTA